MFNCTFCQCQTEDNGYFNHYGICDTCERVQQLAKIYSMKQLLDTLEIVYLRDPEPIANRTKKVKETVKLRNGKQLNISI